MNILPIPALDGGHVVFLIYEMIFGKPAPEKVMLKVICDEQNGYCKLVKSLPDEQFDDFKMVSSATQIKESFDYKTFVKRSFISISKNQPISSFIKIADNPPPIFSF